MQSPSLELKDLCVRAGAGAGKTTNLTHNVLSHAILHKSQTGKWPKVVVTTFTRKATQELRERLLKRAVLEFPEAIEFVRSGHLLTVSTMHGLMDRFLRGHGHERGISPQFALVGHVEGRRYKRRTLRRILKSHPEYGPLMEDLVFKDILSHLESLRSRPLTSKTWTYLRASDQERFARKRLAEDLQSLDDLSRQILAQNPRKEWEEFAQTLQAWTKTWGVAPWAKVRAEIYASLCDLDKPRVNKKVDSLELQRLSDAFPKLRKGFDQYSSPAYDPAYWAHLESRYALLENLSAKFESELEEDLFGQSKMLLEDLEYQALKLLTEFPQTAKEFGQRWSYWMIDEYQDTSPIQVKILDEWVGGSPLYVVGDPQQSIYLFRGARREVFAQMWDRTQKRGDTLFLKTNYRSDPELLNFINWSTQRLGSGFESMDPKETSSAVQGPVATFMRARDEDEEWLQIKMQLLQLLNEEGVRPDQICILARTKKTLADLAARLQEAGFPYYLHAGSSFLQRRAVLDVLQVLRFVLNPWDDKNLLGLLRSPWVGCSDERIQEVAYSVGRSLWEKLRNVGKGWPETDLLEQLLLRRKDQDLKSVVFDFCKERFLFATSYAIDSSGLREANLLKAFHWIENFLRRPGVNLLEVFQADTDLDGGQDADAVSTLEPNRIQLMTCHAAKGLEADYVFLPFLNKKQKLDYWHTLTLHEEASQWGFRLNYQDSDSALSHPAEKDWVRINTVRQMEEEQRVFYVGLTRAKKRAYLSWQVNDDGSVPRDCPASLYSQITSTSKLPFEFMFMDLLSEQQKRDISLKKFELLSQEDPKQYQPWQGGKQVSIQKTSVTREISSDYRPTDLKSLKRGLEKSVRGERVHRIFELLKISDPSSVQTYVERWFGNEAEDVTEAIHFLLGLATPPLREILTDGQAEWSFLMEWEGKLLEGQLDLFGRDGQGRLWVVDYKSGSTDYREKAFEQLKIYAQALKKVGFAQNEKVSLCALYPFEKKVFVEEVNL